MQIGKDINTKEDRLNSVEYEKKLSKFEWFIIIVLMFVAVDIGSFVGWVLTGQIPQGEFYVGLLTKTIIKWITALL